MPKYRVYVTGNIDMDYEVEAEDKYSAGSEAESMFEKEFGSVGPWSAIDWQEAEEIEDES